MKIRRLEAGDAAAVAALDPQWSPADLARIARGAFSERLALVAESPAGGVVGVVLASLIPPEAEIFNLVVAADARRQGVAAALMQAILQAMTEAGIRVVRLEVRESNTAAIRLYQGLGFRPAGRRPQYYHDPAEDALLLESILKRD